MFVFFYQRWVVSLSKLLCFASAQKFAGEGLRTLCLAVRDVDEVYFEEWKQRHFEASISLESREERLDKLYEEIEQNLTLLGATAIEDKLQDG